jgi:menaquinone-specific isochorismate synthase
MDATIAGGTLVSRSVPVGDVAFRSFLAARDAPRIHWASPDGLEVAGCGAAARIAADGPDRFETVRAEATALFADADADGPAAVRPRLFGGFAFRDDHDAVPPWAGFPAAEFVLPAVQLTRTDDGTWLTVTAWGSDADVRGVEARLDATREELADLPQLCPSGDPPGVAGTERTPSRSAWRRQVTDALDHVAAGRLTKVTLAQALSVTLQRPVSVPEVLERLRVSYPDCYRFFVEPTDGEGFFGAPPERLVTLRNRTVHTEALAGSVGRGETPETDDELAASLAKSEKLQVEHGVVADTIREQLAPLAEHVAVGDRRVRKLATIQHLQTPITAELRDDEHVLSVVEALHPTPAVGGLPPEAALRTITETETFDRGWYAAPVGWFDADGDGSFAVAIRSGVAASRAVTLFAGNGIVADSDPDEEWDELQLKFRPILDELEVDR